jgi:uncharacterized protein (UPF0332 family)
MTTFDGGAFLDTAKKLQGGTAADKRSAISRAYYAAFTVAKEYVRACNADEIHDAGADHASVPRYLQRLRHFQESNKLLKLKDYRHASDYCQPVIHLEAKVDTAISSAMQLVAKYQAM